MLAVAASPAGAGGGLAVAAAQTAASQTYTVCFAPVKCAYGMARGTITWHNRTATVTGDVTDQPGGGSTTVVFEAYAWATKIDSTTRTANADSSLGSHREYSFTIGDTDLVGGIDRIKITVCRNQSSGVACGEPKNYQRP